MDSNNAPHNAKEWLNRRGISDIVLDEFQIGYTSKEIIIPIFDESGKKIFHKYRRSPFSEDGPKYRYEKGASSALYGAHALYKDRTTVITEGELDALALRSQGFIAVSSTGGAGTFDPRWIKYFKGHGDVVICYDRDAAGYKGALNVQQIIPWAKVAMLPNRGNTKDVTDYIAYLSRIAKDVHGKLVQEALETLFSEAVSFPMEERDVLGDEKETIRLYEQRIALAFGRRAERANMGLDPGLIDAYIEHNQSLVLDVKKSLKKTKRAKIEGSDVEKARAFPMTELLKFDRQSFTKCPFHGENTASLHYILKSNKAYCFGSCQKAYDSIDVYMNQNNCSFSDAVEKLKIL